MRSVAGRKDGLARHRAERFRAPQPRSCPASGFRFGWVAHFLYSGSYEAGISARTEIKARLDGQPLSYPSTESREFFEVLFLNVAKAESNLDLRQFAAKINSAKCSHAAAVIMSIAEGSCASGTSKSTELKLTGVARASLEELRLDYEDFHRQRGLRCLLPPARGSFSSPRRARRVRRSS